MPAPARTKRRRWAFVAVAAATGSVAAAIAVTGGDGAIRPVTRDGVVRP